ncbi:erythromycin esterase family protein [Sphingomonas sp. GCM10030256]|uniref:erythromycin esterase family protein n=1 Tax=Sphingomonas sp. GCM10030256 TaxID=3273427 RepID=UPI00361950ED
MRLEHVSEDASATVQSVAAVLRDHSEPLPALSHGDELGALFDRFANADVVLLGEATHGTAEFYQARALITRRLIERHGFSVVAVEGDWPDAARIDGYVRHHRPRPVGGEPFVRFPTWMWRNAEVLAFADWLRGFNEGKPEAEEAGFFGLDVYSLRSSIAAVLHYLDEVDPEEARRARWRYGCLTPWQEDPSSYGMAVLTGRQSRCEDEAVEQLLQLFDKRVGYLRNDGEAWFDAVQNARIVRAAEAYYRAIYRSSTDSWNLRDRHMFQTLQALLAWRGPGTKAVVWAHNSHVGDASATAMGWNGETNIGELCRMAYGQRMVSIGFGTDQGTVAAARDWGGAMEVKSVRPCRFDSWEAAFLHSGSARSLTDWRETGKERLRQTLRVPLLERAIGVIYRPETELTSHYFQAVLADQFDAYVWFARTHAVTPLGHDVPHGAPATYPFGL